MYSSCAVVEGKGSAARAGVTAKSSPKAPDDRTTAPALFTSCRLRRNRSFGNGGHRLERVGTWESLAPTNIHLMVIDKREWHRGQEANDRVAAYTLDAPNARSTVRGESGSPAELVRRASHHGCPWSHGSQGTMKPRKTGGAALSDAQRSRHGNLGAGTVESALRRLLAHPITLAWKNRALQRSSSLRSPPSCAPRSPSEIYCIHGHHDSIRVVGLQRIAQSGKRVLEQWHPFILTLRP